MMIDSGTLPMGRPPGGTPRKGGTPMMSFRIPEPIRIVLEQRVANGEADSVSELVRKALVEYFIAHPRE